MTGAELRSMRKQLGWTQQQLADKAGLSLKTIVKYEQSDDIKEYVALGLKSIMEIEYVKSE